MFQRNNLHPEKVGFLKIAAYVTTCLGLIAAGFTFGQYFKGSSLDNDKLKLERQNITLVDSIERLKTHIQMDSISQRNFVIQNTHYLIFNSDSSGKLRPTLKVSNSTLGPCERGPEDDCWKTETQAKVGDVIAVQIYFRNSGNIEVSNVSLGYRVSYGNSNKTVACSGGIAVGNVIVSQGMVFIYAKEPIKLTYMERNNFIRNYKSKGEFIKADTLFTTPNFKIGVVPAGEEAQGVLVLFFKVEKSD